MPDAYETIVRWYLRFNGYLGVENFVIHEPSAAGVAQGGESDILAVRFPHSREVPGFKIENDCKLLDKQVVEESLIDFVIAEVKSGQNSKGLNALWRAPDEDGRKAERTAYLLRWLGCIKDESTIGEVARELQTHHRAVRQPYLIRLLYFAHKQSQQGVPHGIPQITFRDIAHFFVTVRTSCWRDHGVGVRSAHDQWDPLIKMAWKIGAPTSFEVLHQDEKIELILDLLQAYK